MGNSLANLLCDSWVYLRSLLGLTTPYIIIFMVGIPLIVFGINVSFKWHNRENGGKTLSKIIKYEFFRRQTLIPMSVYLLIWIGLLGWSIIHTAYEKNANKNATITTLEDEIKNLKGKPKEGRANNGTHSPQKPSSNVTYARIVSQKQLFSTNPGLPYALEVIIQTDKTIEPVAFLVKFDGPIGKGNTSISGDGAYIPITQGVRGEKATNFYFEWLSPPLTPDKIVTIDILSKTYVRAIALNKVKYIRQ